jgi:hypothetical protein
MPESYFGPDLSARFEAFRDQALRERHPELLSHFPAAEEALSSSHPWRWVSHALYRNWLRFIDERRGESRRQMAAHL